MKDFEAVLFDLDGTLADTTEYILGAYNHALRAFNLPSVSVEKIVRKEKETFRERYKSLGARTEEEVEELIKLHTAFQHSNKQMISLYPGALETVRKVRERGMKVGIVTGRDRKSGEMVLEITGLAPLVQASVYSDTTARVKPDPGHFLECASLLDTAPEECLVVGDSSVDIIGGNAAGMRTALAAYGYGASATIEEKPDYVINSINGLLRII